MLAFLALLGGCVWVGGFVAIAVVARVARDILEPAEQVAFFRALGRSYGFVGGTGLAVALASGAALLAERRWDAIALAAIVLAALLVLVTTAAVRQARGMTRLRMRALQEPEPRTTTAQVRRGALRAMVLRAAIGVLSLALLVLASVLACTR